VYDAIVLSPAVPVRPRALTPAQLLILSFAGLVAAGTLLLSLPWASAGATRLPLHSALFTATSAVCVTGLIVLDTPTDLTTFGQVVVLLLIQAGGLGYMTFSTLVGVALGRRITLQERQTLVEGLNAFGPGEVVRFARGVFKVTAAIEITGAVILSAWWAGTYGIGRGIWLGLFHAVSAFNNAGFSLFSDNLVGAADEPLVLLTVSFLVILGGIGFFTILEVSSLRRRALRLSVHSQLAIAGTAILLVGGTIAIYFFERDNLATLGSLPAGQAWLAAWFQSAVTRTAGFNSIAIGACQPSALFVMMILMFIGAAPGSTSGGVKVTTVGVLMAALWATARGETEASVFRRRIPQEQISRAFLICLVAFLAVNALAAILLASEGRQLLPTLFEVVSAFATVGMSTGEGTSPLSLSGHFTVTGQLLIALMMFAGRIGPLTLLMAVARRSEASRVRYPEGKVLIG
jgi:trk system potassium uptake protein TrkH